MIGTVVSRDNSPSTEEFYFVVKGEISKGSYVEYSQKGDVIARVAQVFKSNEYLESPENISETMDSDEDLSEKLPVDEWKVTLAKAEIMGKFQNEMIQRVNNAPSPGTELEVADTEKVRQFLGLETEGLNLGSLQQQDVEANFDMTETLQKHFAVLAQSGAGKSYTASVMIEEILDQETSPSIVTVDPHGDYTCFADDPNYMNDTRVFTENEISIAASNLSAEQVSSFFNGISGPQREELRTVFSRLNRGETNDFSLEDVIERIESKEMNDKVKYALMRKLRQLQNMGIFGKHDSPSKNDIEPGKLNILDLSDVINNQKKQIITAYFGKRLFRLRRKGSIPPFLYLLEEAHNFAQEAAPSASKSIIEKIAREGRKFHASLGLISQRPVRLSTTALSQCNTKIILRVTNPNDLDHISQSSEGITSEVAKQIPGLKTGDAIVMGEAVNHPTFIDVRERRSKESESGEGLEDALKDWKSEEEQKKQDAEAFM